MSLVPMFLDATAAPSSTAGMLTTVVPFVAIIAIFYFLIIRPQNKKQKEIEKMIKALKKGDKVVTIGGIHGTVSSTKENTVVVRVDENVRIEFNRSAIATVVNNNPEKITAEKADKNADSEKTESTENK